jgi:hypothetical protein
MGCPIVVRLRPNQALHLNAAAECKARIRLLREYSPLPDSKSRSLTFALTCEYGFIAPISALRVTGRLLNVLSLVCRMDEVVKCSCTGTCVSMHQKSFGKMTQVDSIV